MLPSLTLQADSLTPLGLPEALVHWGHPGNMAVVLLAMGGYGTYLGWQIRTGDDADSIAKAEDLHPKARQFRIPSHKSMSNYSNSWADHELSFVFDQLSTDHLQDVLVR